MTGFVPRPLRNWFLDYVGRDRWNAVASPDRLRPVHFDRNQPIFGLRRPITNPIFLHSGIVGIYAGSVVTTDPRCLVWIPGGVFILGGRQIILGNRSNTVFIALTDVDGESLPYEALLRAMSRDPLIDRMVKELVHFMDRAVLQATPCMRHTREQRLCRHLLMCHDVVKGDLIDLSQETLAELLALNDKSQVSKDLAELGPAVHTEPRRRGVTIRDRQAVLAASCECYPLLIQERNRIFGVKDSNCL